jgi:signal transduction histidine kinase
VALAVVATGVGLGLRRARALIARNRELERTVQALGAELTVAHGAIAQAEKLSVLGRLLAQLSHEINNPLNVIHNNLGPLEEYQRALTAAVVECRGLVSDPAARARVDALWERLDLAYVIGDSGSAFESTREAIGCITHIHGELKTFLRGEPPPRALVDVGACVRTTVTMIARTLPGIDLRCELPPLPPVLASECRLKQTIVNLVQNAADAMGGQGRLDVTGERDARQVRVRVTDDGPGVPPAARARIFEPFFTTKDVGRGLGLGLAICREIAVAHGGTLELDERVTTGGRAPTSARRRTMVGPLINGMTISLSNRSTFREMATASESSVCSGAMTV